MQAHRNQRDADRSGLADAHIATQFEDIEYFDRYHVAAPEDIVLQGGPDSAGELGQSFIGFLLGVETYVSGHRWHLARRWLWVLRVAWRQRGQSPGEKARHKTPRHTSEAFGHSF